MAQIKDVAKQAGVSVASVSRVLAGRPGVSDAIRQRVPGGGQELDYRPDLAARRLRSRQTDTIGLIVSDIRNPFFTEVSRAVEDVAYQHHLRVILCNADEDPEKEALYLDLMRDENVRGVILSPTLSTLAGFRASDYPFPMVLADRCERNTTADAVVLDNVDSAHRLTTHLIDTAVGEISSSTGPPAPPAASGAKVTRRRWRRTAWTRKPRPCRRRWTARGRPPARTARRRPLPDALVASSGLILLGLTEALREAQLRFPDAVALAGFDDLPWTRLVEPGITVIAQPIYDIGKAAIDLLLQRIAQPYQAVRRVVLRGQLMAYAAPVSRGPAQTSAKKTEGGKRKCWTLHESARLASRGASARPSAGMGDDPARVSQRLGVRARRFSAFGGRCRVRPGVQFARNAGGGACGAYRIRAAQRGRGRGGGAGERSAFGPAHGGISGRSAQRRDVARSLYRYGLPANGSAGIAFGGRLSERFQFRAASARSAASTPR